MTATFWQWRPFAHQRPAAGHLSRLPGPGYESGPASIGLAWSDNLQRWQLDPFCLQANDGAAWEQGGLYKSCLVSHLGRYYMFYNAKNRDEWPWLEQIGLAVSDDLVSWKRYPESPVLPVGGSGAWDECFASDPYVLRAGDNWVMFYYGLAKDGHARDGSPSRTIYFTGKKRRSRWSM